MNIVIMTSLSLILLVLICQRIDIRVSKSSMTKIKINFIFFALTVDDSESQKLSLKKRIKLIRNIPFIYSAVKYLISKSEITVHSQNYTSSVNVTRSMLPNIMYRISVPTAIAIVSKFARKVKFDDEDVQVDPSDGLIFDLSVHFRLYRVFISLIIFLYYMIRAKFRRIIKNV